MKYSFKYSTQTINPEGKLVYEYNPLYNFRTSGRTTKSRDAEGNLLDKNRNIVTKEEDAEIIEDGMLQDLITGVEGSEDVLGFDLEHPVDIQCLQSYDGSVNLILNDNNNIPRLINTRFTALENNTYKRVDRIGNTDTNIYDENEFDIDTSLFKRYNTIPKIKFQGVYFGGNLKVGNYVFYFKLADGDGNETDFVGESGLVSIYVGTLNAPSTIRGGQLNENGNKCVKFSLLNIDSAYDYVNVYYSRATGADNCTATKTAHKINKSYRISSNGMCNITINGDEDTTNIELTDLLIEHFIASKSKTLAICQNHLFLGNVQKSTLEYEELLKLSLNFLPFYNEIREEELIGFVQYNYSDPFGKYEYYNPQNIYNYVGYWPEELYRFGIVYIMDDNSLSPVFNIRGGVLENYFNTSNNRNDPNPILGYGKFTDLKNVVIDRDTQFINNSTLENSAGVVLFPKMHVETNEETANENIKTGNLPIYSLVVKASQETLTELKKLKVKGYFFVRQKRIPTILAQAFSMGVDAISGLPMIYNGTNYEMESFLNAKGYLEGTFEERQIMVQNSANGKFAAICPEFEQNQPHYNTLFTGGSFAVKPIADLSVMDDQGRLYYTNWNRSMGPIETHTYSLANIVSVADACPAIRCNDFTFRAKAGNAEDIKFEYVLTDANPPKKSNFEHVKRKKKRLKWLKALTTVVGVMDFLTPGIATVMATAVSATSTLIAAGASVLGNDTLAKSAAETAKVSAAVAGGSFVLPGIAGVTAGVAMPSSTSTATSQIVKNKVKIVRGAYGPYLGLTDNTTLKPNQLFNIYIPGYLDTSESDRFTLRIDDSSPYYSVSDRITLTIPETSEEIINNIFRGDCYISTYTHRINRNFQDPDAPNNDKIIDEKTWVNNWDADKKEKSDVNRGDVNAIKLGSWITFKCYTSSNLSLRDVDGSYPSEEALIGHKREFYPLSQMSVDGNSKVPESFCYNQGFSVSTGEQARFIVPNVPYIKNVYLTRIMYSNTGVTDSFKNGLREFNSISYRDYPNQYGGLMKLVNFNENLIAVFEHGVALVPINLQALIPTDDGTLIAIGAKKLIPDTLQMLSDKFGSLWPESVVASDTAVYGVDTVGKKIWRIQENKFEIISDFKVQKFLNDNITLGERELTPIIGVRNVKTHFNAYKNDVMFTFYDNLNGFEEKAWNLCWNELSLSFTTFYSWIPSYSANIDNIFFSYDRDSSKWITKLGMSTAGKNGLGVCVDSTLMDTISDSFMKLSLLNKPIPTDSRYKLSYKFNIERDNFRNDKYFNIVDEERDLFKDLSDPSIYWVKYPELSTEYLLLHKTEFYYKVHSYSYVSYDDLQKLFSSDYINAFNFVKKANGIYKKLNTNDERKPPYLILTSENKKKLLDHMMSQVPIIPVVQLNIKCDIEVTDTQTSSSTDSSNLLNLTNWSNYFKYNYGYYQTLLFLTFDKVIDHSNANYTYSKDGKTITVNYPDLRTDFWKHGFAGIIDIQDKIKPCYWYGKQHPFEFEFVVGNQSAIYKLFTNFNIISNNVKPESLHYEINGDSYDFVDDKRNMYFRLEATKAFYLYNGSDILYNHNTFGLNGITPEVVTTENYVKGHRANDTIKSNVYKASVMPLLYSRQDTFNEIEDFYKEKISSGKDYTNLTGGELIWDEQFDKISLVNHVKLRDIKEYGRITGNIQYINDRWDIQVSPFTLYQWNDSFSNGVPKIVVNNIPEDIYEYNTDGVDLDPTNMYPDELIKVGYKNRTSSTSNNETDLILDDVFESRKEFKPMDKYMKVKLRYDGKKLVNVLAVNTIYNTYNK